MKQTLTEKFMYGESRRNIIVNVYACFLTASLWCSICYVLGLYYIQHGGHSDVNGNVNSGKYLRHLENIYGQ